MSEEEKTFTHPSYGLVGLTRTSGRLNLFGSSVDHLHYISLTIHRAKMVRSMNNDHFYPTKEMMRISMSPLQLSELLINMNVGHGVPCTLARVIGENGRYESVTPPPSSVQSTTETYTSEFKQRMADLVQDAESLVAEADAMAEKTSASKRERREVVSKLSGVIQEIRSNLPFVLDMYVEQVEKVVTQAKAEIESYQHMMQLSGKVTTKSLDLKTTKGMCPQASCPKCVGTGELPDGEGCGCSS